jgi:THAP domain
MAIFAPCFQLAHLLSGVLTSLLATYMFLTSCKLIRNCYIVQQSNVHCFFKVMCMTTHNLLLIHCKVAAVSARIQSGSVKRKKYGGDFCCVPNCSNQRGKDSIMGVKRSYFSFPTDPRRLKLWLNNIRRGGGWKPRPWDRVCADHFANG